MQFKFTAHRTVFVLFCVFTAFYGVLPLVSQEAATPGDAATRGTAATATADRLAVDETTLRFNPDTEAAGNPAAAGPASNLWLFVRMVLVLAIVCLGIYGLIVFLRKNSTASAASDPWLKSVASIPLPAGKSVQVVTIGGKAFLIGVTDHAVNLLCELTDQEIIDAMNLDADRQSAIPGTDFAALLGRFFPKLKNMHSSPDKGSSSSSFSSSLQNGEFLKNQRERLNRRENPDQNGRSE